MKFWTDKYVATRGVFSFNGDLYDGKYASESKNSAGRLFLRLGRDAWGTREEAVVSARKRLKRSLAAIEIKRIKIEKLIGELTP